MQTHRAEQATLLPPHIPSICFHSHLLIGSIKERLHTQFPRQVTGRARRPSGSWLEGGRGRKKKYGEIIMEQQITSSHFNMFKHLLTESVRWLPDRLISIELEPSVNEFRGGEIMKEGGWKRPQQSRYRPEFTRSCTSAPSNWINNRRPHFKQKDKLISSLCAINERQIKAC